MAKLLIFYLVCFLCKAIIVSATEEDDSIAVELGKLKETITDLPDGKEKNILLKAFDSTEQEKAGRVKEMSQKIKVKDMLAAINGVIPKFRSNKTEDILAGCGDLLLGISMAVGGPYGMAFSVVASMFSAVMGMISPKKVEKSMASIIEDALKKQRDSELKDEAHGIKTLFRNYKAAQDRFRDSLFNSSENISDGDILALAPHDKIYEPTKFTGILSRRINTATEKNAESTLEFVILSAQICKLHLSILIDVKTLIDLSGRMKATANMVGGVIEQSKTECRENIDFLRLENMDQSYYRLLGFYYPPKQSQRTMEVERMLNTLQVPPVTPFFFKAKFRYVISPEAYKGTVLCAASFVSFDNYGVLKELNEIQGCPGQTNKKLWNRISPVENGFYEIQIATRYTTLERKVTYFALSRLCAVKQGNYTSLTIQEWSKGACKGDNIKFTLVPIVSSGSKFLLEPKITKGSFIYLPGKADQEAKLIDKDPGNKGYWKNSE